MARYQIRRHGDGFAVVDEATGLVAMANGHWLEGLELDDASELVDRINCLEGEVLLDADDLPEAEQPVAQPAMPQAARMRVALRTH